MNAGIYTPGSVRLSNAQPLPVSCAVSELPRLPARWHPYSLSLHAPLPFNLLRSPWWRWRREEEAPSSEDFVKNE